MESFPLLMMGLNHRATPVEVRERLAFGPERAAVALQELAWNPECSQAAVAEVVLLSTCNRTEVYVQAHDLPAAERRVQEFLIRYSRLPADNLQSMQYGASGEAAALHLLQVAAGLDSLILGENEILGQVRSASELAQAAGTNGPILGALFQSAIRAGKRARAETGIASEGLSVASVVVELAGQMLGPLADRTALLIGAGKISSMTARALRQAGLRCILIANRTFERAQELARRLDGLAVHFDALDENLRGADIVICSTGAPHLVLHAASVARAQEQRGGRPLLVADLAVPRDADPEIAALPGVQLVNIDDLETVMKSRHAANASAIGEVQQILHQELDSFLHWCAARRCAPLIASLNRKAENIYQAEVQETLRRLGPLSPRQEQLVASMAKAIAGKLLHEPITCLRELPQDEDISPYVEVVQELYRLP